ncbi:hypothetical protein [Piscinibacterium candidicorallinum]|uniref:Secreted protein n=1 Tax=Piscinibacterium candidicorallinum TaxID=1793872 RepID=A0ABV7H549_9BURK
MAGTARASAFFALVIGTALAPTARTSALVTHSLAALASGASATFAGLATALHARLIASHVGGCPLEPT